MPDLEYEHRKTETVHYETGDCGEKPRMESV